MAEQQGLFTPLDTTKFSIRELVAPKVYDSGIAEGIQSTMKSVANVVSTVKAYDNAVTTANAKLTKEQQDLAEAIYEKNITQTLQGNKATATSNTNVFLGEYRASQTDEDRLKAINSGVLLNEDYKKAFIGEDGAIKLHDTFASISSKIDADTILTRIQKEKLRAKIVAANTDAYNESLGQDKWYAEQIPSITRNIKKDNLEVNGISGAGELAKIFLTGTNEEVVNALKASGSKLLTSHKDALAIYGGDNNRAEKYQEQVMSVFTQTLLSDLENKDINGKLQLLERAEAGINYIRTNSNTAGTGSHIGKELLDKISNYKTSAYRIYADQVATVTSYNIATETDPNKIIKASDAAIQQLKDKNVPVELYPQSLASMRTHAVNLAMEAAKEAERKKERARDSNINTWDGKTNKAGIQQQFINALVTGDLTTVSNFASLYPNVAGEFTSTVISQLLAQVPVTAKDKKGNPIDFNSKISTIDNFMTMYHQYVPLNAQDKTVVNTYNAIKAFSSMPNPEVLTAKYLEQVSKGYTPAVQLDNKTTDLINKIKVDSITKQDITNNIRHIVAAGGNLNEAITNIKSIYEPMSLDYGFSLNNNTLATLGITPNKVNLLSSSLKIVSDNLMRTSTDSAAVNKSNIIQGKLLRSILDNGNVSVEVDPLDSQSVQISIGGDKTKGYVSVPVGTIKKFINQAPRFDKGAPTPTSNKVDLQNIQGFTTIPAGSNKREFKFNQ